MRLFRNQRQIRKINPQAGQGLLECALAMPALLVLFMGSLQLAQIGLGHMLVLTAAYEAGRHYAVHQNPEQAAEKASRLCRIAGRGETELHIGAEEVRVSHALRPLFAVLGKIMIAHGCRHRVFAAGIGQEEAEP